MTVEIGAKFPAKWKGSCTWCGEAWTPGEEIGFVDDDLVCTKCRMLAIEANIWERYSSGEINI